MPECGRSNAGLGVAKRWIQSEFDLVPIYCKELNASILGNLKEPSLGPDMASAVVAVIVAPKGKQDLPRSELFCNPIETLT